MKTVKIISTLAALVLASAAANAQITINIRYSGQNGAARKYVQEMEESGIAQRIRQIEGCVRYDYFFPADDPEGVLLIDQWADQEALNRYHSSPMMNEAGALREKYGLGNRQISMYSPATPGRPSAAQSPSGGTTSVWPQGEPNPYGQYFTGNSYLASLGGGLSNVTFEPGCRNNWHIHHKQVQVLVCVSGHGWYQEWGKPAVEMKPGTVITVPAGTKHWHGAAPDSPFQHLAYFTDIKKKASNEWLEPVTDEQYRAATSAR